MAAEPQTSAPSAEIVSQNEGDNAAREAWLTDTLDPWTQIALLEQGGDRSFASAVEHTVRNAQPEQHAALEAKLLGAFSRPELTEAGRLFICQMLGLIGSTVCVPQVSPLLSDNRTADVARLALDAIADLGLDAVYRAALGRLSGRPKAGVIGSIAHRGDVQAMSLLQHIAIDPTETAEVRRAADRAVERLAAAT
jgi:hypothetical protein